MNGHTATGTLGPKRGMAEMLKGGVIIDVLTAEAMKWRLDVPRAGAATVDRADTSARTMH